MGSATLVGAIDQGTTSTRFILYRVEGPGLLAKVSSHQMEHRQIYPQPGCEPCLHPVPTLSAKPKPYAMSLRTRTLGPEPWALWAL